MRSNRHPADPYPALTPKTDRTSARTGRWLARDPILFDGGTANLYEYCGNDPVNCTDPSGMAPPLLAAIGAGMAFGAGIELGIQTYQIYGSGSRAGYDWQ